jgi:hypothetical protein
MKIFFYYIALYFTVAGISFLKVKSKYKNYDYPNYKHERWCFSLDIVYAAASVMMLVFSQLSEYVELGFICYAGLIVFSAMFLAMDGDRTTIKQKITYHSVITGITILFTFAVLISIEINKSAEKCKKIADLEKEKQKPKEFLVIVPFLDNSLANQVGQQKMVNKFFYYQNTIKSPDPDSARNITLREINLKRLIQPMYLKKIKSKLDTCYIQYERITVIETKNITRNY